MPVEWVVTTLCGTITALAGVIVFLYRDNLKRADERIQKLESMLDDRDERMDAFAETMSQLVNTIGTINSAVQKTADYIAEEAMARKYRDGKGGGG